MRARYGVNGILFATIDGERHLVDLGPSATFKVQREPTTKITVVGILVRTQGHRVILAGQVQAGDEVIETDNALRFFC